MRTTVPQGVLRSWPIAVLTKAEAAHADALVTRLGLAAARPDLVIAGYASPQVVDKERHLITREALARDLPRFLANPHYRNVNLLHSNITVGEVLPSWRDPHTGRVYRTHVDRIGLFVVVKIRTDPFRPPIVDKVIDDILTGKIASFSISADAPYEARQHRCAEGVCFYVIDKISYYEITVCESPVNTDARFTILQKALPTSDPSIAAYLASAYCQDGSCLLPTSRILKNTLEREAEPLLMPRTSVIREDDRRPAPRIRTTPSRVSVPRRTPDSPYPVKQVVTMPQTVRRRRPVQNHPAILNQMQEHTGRVHPSLQKQIDAWIGRATYNKPDTFDDDYQDNIEDGRAIPVQGEPIPVPVTKAARTAALGPKRLTKDNEASSDPAARTGSLIEGQDDPTPKPLSQPVKQARLQGPTSGSPVIMKAIAAMLARAALDLHEQNALHLATHIAKHQQPPLLYTGDATDPWHLGHLPLVPYLAQLRRAATEHQQLRLANQAALLRTRLLRSLPLDAPTATQVADTIFDRTLMLGVASDTLLLLGSQLRKGSQTPAAARVSPQALLSRLYRSLGQTVRDPQIRRSHDPRTLAALDTLYEDTGYALDGLQLGLSIGLADGGDLAGAGSSDGDPVAPGDPREQGFEAHILREAGALNTLKNVQQADALLRASSVAKAVLKKKQVISQTEARYRRAEGPSCCANCTHFWQSGTACELVNGPISRDGVCDFWEGHAQPQPTDPRTPPLNRAEKKILSADQRDGAMIPATKEDEWQVTTEPDEDTPAREVLDKATFAAEPPRDLPKHAGAMIAWYPTTGTAKQLAGRFQDGDNREPPEELHVTLVYLTNDAARLGPEAREQIRQVLRRQTLVQHPLDGAIAGVGRFTPSAGSDNQEPLVALVDVPGLSEFRARLVSDLTQHGIRVPQDHGFTPHMTLRYDPPGMDDLPDRGIPRIESTPISIEKIHLVWGGEHEEFSLDAGVGQVSGTSPEVYERARNADHQTTDDQQLQHRLELKASDADARAYAGPLARIWQTSFHDPRYQLVIAKAASDGSRTILLPEAV